MASSAEPVLVLVVDDDALFRQSMAIALRLEGLQVVEAATVSEARGLIREHRFALAVVDMLLGAERGDEILEEISRVSPETRLAAMTGHPYLVSPAVESGRAVQLHKPLSPEALLGLLQR